MRFEQLKGSFTFLGPCPLLPFSVSRCSSAGRLANFFTNWRVVVRGKTKKFTEVIKIHWFAPGCLTLCLFWVSVDTLL